MAITLQTEEENKVQRVKIDVRSLSLICIAFSMLPCAHLNFAVSMDVCPCLSHFEIPSL